MMRRLLRFAENTLALLAPWPRVAFAVTDTLATVAALASFNARAARREWVNEFRGMFITGWVRRGGVGVLQPLIRPNSTLADLRAPVILATFHIGPMFALSTVADNLTSPVLLIRAQHLPGARPPHVTAVNGLADEHQRAAAFLAALRMLRKGGAVMMAIDPVRNGVEAPFLGQRVRLAPGAFRLARMSGAPIVPLAARWAGNEIEIVRGEAVAGEDEEALAAAIARWLENHVIASPGALNRRLRRLMKN